MVRARLSDQQPEFSWRSVSSSGGTTAGATRSIFAAPRRIGPEHSERSRPGSREPCDAAITPPGSGSGNWQGALGADRGGTYDRKHLQQGATDRCRRSVTRAAQIGSDRGVGPLDDPGSSKGHP